jgi:hypothetical protein
MQLAIFVLASSSWMPLSRMAAMAYMCHLARILNLTVLVTPFHYRAHIANAIIPCPT